MLRLTGASVNALNASAVVEPDSATVDVHGFRLNIAATCRPSVVRLE